MARLLDANTVYAGLEPKYTKELSQIELMKALNWYSQNKDTKDAYKYASDYFKKNLKTDIGEVIKEYPSTFGWLCRIVSNGGSLSIKNQVYFDDKVKEIKNAVDEAKKKPKVVEQKPTTPKVYKLETHEENNMLYLYNRDTNSFICQAPTIEELAKLAKDYKNITAASVLHGKKVFMFMDGNAKEYT